MDREQLRAFAGRDWRAIARAKREHQAALFREQGPAAMVRAARDLFVRARAANPAWPSAREREADLLHHFELHRSLARVRR
jgi:hypothetical protein